MKRIVFILSLILCASLCINARNVFNPAESTGATPQRSFNPFGDDITVDFNNIAGTNRVSAFCL